MPAHTSQPTKSFHVPAPVPCDFWSPVFESGLRHPTEPAFVPVPEAAVDEDDLTLGTEHEVGSPRKVGLVQPIAVSHAMNEPPDQHLRLRILRAHQTHLLAAVASAHIVHDLNYMSEGGRTTDV